MIRLRLLPLLLLLASAAASARIIPADPNTYVTFLTSLQPGDTLALATGTYTKDLALKNISGTESAPVVIMGSPVLYTTVFKARSCCNTVSITQCAYVVIKNLWLDGGGVQVDAVKGEGTAGNWAHHITLEYLNITGYGGDQQLVGISTKCHAWNWTIRKNRIIGAGTGLYLGNSDGDKPFVNGLIEYNLVLNPVGYCMEIKHQNVSVRDAFPGTAVDGRTIIRHNVFCKESGASTGANARPNVLLGAFPASGAGANDVYEMYGNFLYQNPVEALLQSTGNLALYNNVFVNHSDGSGMRAVYITAQNGFRPRDVRIFHNTVWAANSAGGIRIYNADPAYRQYCHGNAVFSPSPVTNFTDTLDNVVDTYVNAAQHVVNASNDIAALDLYPRAGRLAGGSTPSALFAAYTEADIDFNGTSYSWTSRGAYSGCCVNPGWKLQLDTMSETPQHVVHGLPAYPAPTGVYCSCGPTTGTGNGSVDPQVAAKEFVRGILVRITWEKLEPADGIYNWSLLDGQISAANSYHKKISLAIGCGIGIPQWVFAAGAQRLVASAPIADTIAVPWDPVFLSRWTRFIAALGARYRSDTTITLVYITHSTGNGFEMQLPFVTSPTLTAAGYSDANMIAAWKRVVDAYDAAFPNHYITNDFHPVNGSDVVADSVYAYAARTIGVRYGANAWWWTQKNTTVYPAQYAILRTSAQENAFTGVQMAYSGTGSPASFGPGGMPAALQLAITDRVCYWEVWNNDILNPAFDSLLAHASCTGVTGVGAASPVKSELQIFPNPSHGWVQCINSAASSLHLTIYNVLGDIVHTQVLAARSQVNLDLTHLRPGVHLLRTSTEDGETHHRILIILG